MVETSSKSTSLANVGEKFGKSPEECFDLAIDNRTSSDQLAQFAAGTELSMSPGERAEALAVFAKAAGSVAGANRLLEEGGALTESRVRQADAANALYLLADARGVKGEKIFALESTRDVSEQREKEATIARGKLENALAVLELVVEHKTCADAAGVTATLSAIARLVTPSLLGKIQQLADSTLSPFTEQGLEIPVAQLRHFADNVKELLNSALEANIRTGVRKATEGERLERDPNAVEFSTWVDFCTFFDIESRDIKEGKLLSKLRRSYKPDPSQLAPVDPVPGRKAERAPHINHILRAAIKTGIDISSKNVVDVINNWKRGNTPDPELIPIDRQEVEDWNGDEGW
jgi:hypothetical protein